MKKTIMKIMLVALPFMAVVLATTGDSVKLVEIATGKTLYGSYFTMLNDSTAALCPFLAALCGIISTLTAGLFLLSKSRRKGFLKTSAWTAFAGACLAVIPVMLRETTMLIPNVGLPILLMGQFILSAFAGKIDLESKEKAQGRRLEQH